MSGEIFSPRIVEYRVRMNLEEKLLTIEADVMLKFGVETVSLYTGTYDDDGHAAEIMGDMLGKRPYDVHELAETQYFKKLCSAR